MWRVLACCLFAVGCTNASGVGDDEPDPSSPDAGAADCARAPAAADRDRFAVIAHPYRDGGGNGQSYEVLRLDTAGTLTETGTTFEMGRATGGRIVFSPDGGLGFVAQEDGTLGVFRIDEAGDVTVVDPAFDGGFYAASVQMDPSGARVFVLDTQWRENGGGVYSVAVDCDDSVVTAATPAALPQAAGPRSRTRCGSTPPDSSTSRRIIVAAACSPSACARTSPTKT